MPKESAGTNAGKFRAIAYQNGMMDAVTDPLVSTITVMKSARVGYTVMLNNIVGYHIHQEPAAMLLVQPTIEDAQDYSRSFIAPMIRDTPVLKEIAGETKFNDQSQRLSKRSFPNGAWIQFIGANSPGGFRRITAQIIMFDEVDGFPVEGAGEEGDQIALGSKRATTEWNSKIILGSTPTVKGVSRIEKSYADSDQRHYHVPCPHCGEKQILDWEFLKWNSDKDDKGNSKHFPQTAYFVCRHNGCIIEEKYKGAMIAGGEWIADKPFAGHAGFHISALYSVFPKVTWGNIVKEFLDVKHDPVRLKVWINTVLGQTWEEQGKTVDASGLLGRRENYDEDTIPQGVVMLTAGIDTQDDRLEYSIIGWGAKEESWHIKTDVINGDPAQPGVWKRLEEVLRRRYTRDDGRSIRIMASCIDSGGHHTERVYAFAKANLALNVYAVKGLSTSGNPVWPKRLSHNKETGYKWAPIGVDTAKDAIYARLGIAEHGPGYIHFNDDCDDAYFAQLTAEKIVVRYRAGRPYRVFVCAKGTRNEALDMFVYALAAMKSTGKRLDRRLSPEEVAERAEQAEAAVAAPVSVVEPAVVQTHQPETAARQKRRAPPPPKPGFLGQTKSIWSKY